MLSSRFLPSHWLNLCDIFRRECKPFPMQSLTGMTVMERLLGTTGVCIVSKNTYKSPYPTFWLYVFSSQLLAVIHGNHHTATFKNFRLYL
ncbi:MAG TPA: hypothetical protein V6D48_01445 [Oculatellaceae cyanobacterium]